MVLDLATYTTIHVVISLIALGSGIAVVADLFAPRVRRSLTALFLVTAVLTSATGFGFPFSGVLPSHILSGIALVTLAAAIYALYAARLSGFWRLTYAISIVANLFFLVFVGIVQAFGKIPFLHSFAPNGNELPVTVSQIVALVIFVALGIAAAKVFHPSVREAMA
jgi:hypothetical protein